MHQTLAIDSRCRVDFRLCLNHSVSVDGMAPGDERWLLLLLVVVVVVKL